MIDQEEAARSAGKRCVRARARVVVRVGSNRVRVGSDEASGAFCSIRVSIRLARACGGVGLREG